MAKTQEYIPYPAPEGVYVLQKTMRDGQEPNDKSDLPVPPESQWEGYGKTVEDFLAGGKSDCVAGEIAAARPCSWLKLFNNYRSDGCRKSRGTSAKVRHVRHESGIRGATDFGRRAEIINRYAPKLGGVSQKQRPAKTN
jgi:hypothetical protein